MVRFQAWFEILSSDSRLGFTERRFEEGYYAMGMMQVEVKGHIRSCRWMGRRVYSVLQAYIRYFLLIYPRLFR